MIDELNINKNKLMYDLYNITYSYINVEDLKTMIYTPDRNDIDYATNEVCEIELEECLYNVQRVIKDELILLDFGKLNIEELLTERRNWYYPNWNRKEYKYIYSWTHFWYIFYIKCVHVLHNDGICKKHVCEIDESVIEDVQSKYVDYFLVKFIDE